MTSLTVPLVPQGDAGSAYRLLNEYEGQIERPNVLDYGTNLNVQVDLVEVIYGTLAPEGDLATLIIADFQFSSLDPPRRFHSARITFHFRDSDPKDRNPPEVLKIAPQGLFSMNHTEKQQELKRGVNLSVSGGYGPAGISLGFDWRLTESMTRHDYAKLTGVRNVIDRGRPPKNAAVWSLDENPSDDKGIPSFLRAVILLKRKSYENFIAIVSVDAKVDWKYKLEKRAGRVKVDPVTFDPDPTRPCNTVHGIDPKNLGLIDLNELKAVQSNVKMFECRGKQGV